MQKRAIPTQKDFTTKVKEWQLRVSYNCLPQQGITFSLKSKQQKQVHYRETYYPDNLPPQIKENYFKEVYDLYLFLERENDKGINIYDFLAQDTLLRFAYRVSKKVFSLKFRKFVNGVEQKANDNLGLVKKSHRYSANLNKMSVRQTLKKEQVNTSIGRQQRNSALEVSNVNQVSSISQAKQSKNYSAQPVISLNQTLNINNATQTLHYPSLQLSQKQDQDKDQDAQLDYFYDAEEQQPKPQLKFTEEQQIDYDQWITTIYDNGPDILLSKVVCYQVGDYLANEDQDDNDQPNPYDLKRKLIHSEVYQANEQESDQHVVMKDQKGQVDFKQVVKENVKLRHENSQFILKLADLQRENQSLKHKIKTLQQQYQINQNLPINNQIHPYPNIMANSQLHPKILNNQNSTVSNSFTPFSQGPPALFPLNSITHSSFNQSPNSFPLPSNTNQFTPGSGASIVPPFFQLIQASFNKTEEWSTQYNNMKRPIIQSKFYQYLDFHNQRLDICYKEYSLKDFEDNLFPYDWSQVKILNIDGNMLMKEGFDKVISNLWPNVTEISAGYNVIKDVRNLERLHNLTKIDLRANPLSEFTKSYLESLKRNSKIQIFY